MKTRCPHCGTRAEVDTETLIAAGGQARCHHCNGLFDALGEHLGNGDQAPPTTIDTASTAERDEDERELPFDVPDDLEPMAISADAALDIEHSLDDTQGRYRTIFGGLALLLALTLALQLAWQYRFELLARFPQLEPVCEQLACRPATVYSPGKFQVLQRDIKPASNEPDALTLTATIRNGAAAAQALPDIQLSLLDNNGGVLIRRRLAPYDYLFPPPTDDRRLHPGEVFTITLDFKDPGYQATGFMIDFL